MGLNKKLQTALRSNQDLISCRLYEAVFISKILVLYLSFDTMYLSFTDVYSSFDNVYLSFSDVFLSFNYVYLPFSSVDLPFNCVYLSFKYVLIIQLCPFIVHTVMPFYSSFSYGLLPFNYSISIPY